MAWNLRLRRRTPWQPLPLVNGWAGAMYIKRVSDTVWVKCEGLDGSAATSTVAALIPPGYRAEGTVNERGLLHTTSSAVSRWWCSLNAFSSPSGLAAPLYGSASWDTTDLMPTGGA